MGLQKRKTCCGTASKTHNNIPLVALSLCLASCMSSNEQYLGGYPPFLENGLVILLPGDMVC